MNGCPCCQGQVDFDWYEEACDDCASAILAGEFTPEAHGHEMSRNQLAAIEEAEDA